MARAHRDDVYAARAMLAYRRGDDTHSAMVGAMLEAEFFRLIHTFFTTK